MRKQTKILSFLDLDQEPYPPRPLLSPSIHNGLRQLLSNGNKKIAAPTGKGSDKPANEEVDKKGNLPSRYTDVIHALYFLGAENLQRYWNVLYRHPVTQDLLSQFPSLPEQEQKQEQEKKQDLNPQQRQLIGYALIRYLLAKTEKPVLVRNYFSPHLPEEIDYWFESTGFKPSPSTHPLLPLKAEEDPRLRRWLFWDKWGFWKVINKDPATHWFEAPPGSGLSAAIRMGQHAHRPWASKRFGFSLYIYMAGAFSPQRWEEWLATALYRSLQRALLEDPTWFFLAPEETRLLIQHFMDAHSPRASGWQPPSLWRTTDTNNKNVTSENLTSPSESQPSSSTRQNPTSLKRTNPLDWEQLKDEFARLRYDVSDLQKPPSSYLVLQRSFATLRAYHQLLTSTFDEKPWLWIEVPADHSPRSQSLRQKVRFLLQEEDLWTYLTPKIFLPYRPTGCDTLSTIRLTWTEEEIQAMLQHRLARTGWQDNIHFWDKEILEKLEQLEEDPLGLKEIFTKETEDKIAIFCRRAAAGCSTPAEALRRLQSYRSLFTATEGVA